MIEVEVKLPVQNHADIRKNLTEQGYAVKSLVREEDHYFDSPDGRIRKGGEAIRIRRTEDLLTGKVDAFVTFKGKKTDQVSMTRRELETGIADAEVMKGILEALGYEEVLPAVIKTREELSREDMNACLDRVEDLGSFLELEIVLSESEDQQIALQRIEIVLQSLGYSLAGTIRTSYLSLLQKRTD